MSYVAINDHKRAIEDFDEALEKNPRNLEAWTSRGLAWERLGDKEKAAGSYARALNINQNYQPAVAGFQRVGGRYGQTYQIN
jgi:Tfp pilus assembly protein PilF